MPDVYRFQFTVVNEKMATILRAVPVPYRSLFVEMAFEAHFGSKDTKAVCHLCSVMKTDKRKPVRLRISLTNETIIKWLRSISVRHRSLFAESALAAFMETEVARKMFCLFSSRSSKPLPFHVRPEEKDIRNVVIQNKPVQREPEKLPETEALMKNVLQFK